MVTNATSLGRSGLFDWLVQRFSALVLLAWVAWVSIGVIAAAEFGYPQWRALFAAVPMQIFSLIAVLSLCAHAWVGVWTVTTDYLNEAHLGKAGTAIRLLTQIACLLLTLSCLIWGARIFWGSG